MSQRILIIKLGALGDMVQATTAFAALRVHHARDTLVLLTTQAYGDFAKRLGCFDEIRFDTRPKLHQWHPWVDLMRLFRHGQFNRVYDLQDVDRTRLYRRFCPRTTEWIQPPASVTPQHPQDRFQQQLQRVGIENLPPFTLESLAEKTSAQPLQPYVLLIPGASHAHGGRKRWPESHYADLAAYFVQNGITPVVIGGPNEHFPQITGRVPQTVNLVGHTTYYQIISLAKGALLAVGNDTGPMLLAAGGGCPTLTLYSAVNPRAIGGPQGPKSFFLEENFLDTLKVETVINKIVELYAVLEKGQPHHRTND